MQAQRLAAESDAVSSDSGAALGPGHDGHFGRWRLLERLASGGTATLYRAADDAGNEAALKVLHRRADDYLCREHEALRRFRHPNVVRPVGIVEGHEDSALALEYLSGGDLVALLASPPRHSVPVLRDVLAVAVHLHARGFAHCDLKARNVMFAADGATRLIDFGSVRPLDAALRRSVATAACTPARDVTSGRAADCFAFGVLVYECLTGSLPFGVDGMRCLGEEPRAAVPAEPVTAALLATALAVLRAGGEAREGLSVFVDVIESAVAAYY
jgi:serine/threonine protein kinase